VRFLPLDVTQPNRRRYDNSVTKALPLSQDANLTGATSPEPNLYRTYLYSAARSWSRVNETDLPNATLCSTIMRDGHMSFRDCPK
jgi:hypothetical protein